MTAPIVEMFSSIQGEGLLLGERQVFLRFAGCNLCCAYCDTRGAQAAPECARLERTPGRRDFLDVPGAMTPEEVAEAVRRLVRPQADLHHSVSLTGGEPLLHAAFLKHLLPLLGDLGLAAYLETNGPWPKRWPQVIEGLDVVCADIKLPSATGQGPLWGAHEMFLLTLAAYEDPHRLDFVKVVVVADSTPEELDRARATGRGPQPADGDGAPASHAHAAGDRGPFAPADVGVAGRCETPSHPRTGDSANAPVGGVFVAVQKRGDRHG